MKLLKLTCLFFFISLDALAFDAEAGVLPKVQSLFIQQNLVTKVSVKENDDYIGYNIQENVIVSRLGKEFNFGGDTELNVTLNHSFTAGYGCFFSISDINLSLSLQRMGAPASKVSFSSFWYCGPRVAFTAAPYSVVHPKLTVLYGDGKIATSQMPTSLYLPSRRYAYRFNILKPTVALEANLMNILRISFGLGYRIILSNQSNNNDADNQIRTGLQGFEFSLSFTLGSF